MPARGLKCACHPWQLAAAESSGDGEADEETGASGSGAAAGGASFDYLLSMSLFSLTQEKIAQLKVRGARRQAGICGHTQLAARLQYRVPSS